LSEKRYARNAVCPKSWLSNVIKTITTIRFIIWPENATLTLGWALSIYNWLRKNEQHLQASDTQIRICG